MSDEYEEEEVLEEEEELRESWFSGLYQRTARSIRLLQQPWLPLLALALLVTIGGWVAWREFGPTILQDPRFSLTREQIQVTPQPEWIRSDVKADVIRDARLDELSLQDHRLVKKIKEAFSVHTWVAEARVRKSPAGVEVQVEYRRPVAMVETMYVYDGQAKRGVIPVDREGVVLPPANFAPDGHLDPNFDGTLSEEQLIAYKNQLDQYLRISVPRIKSVSLPGIQWGDQRVHDAARIASVWGDDWKKIGIYKIIAAERSPKGHRPEFVEFELTTRQQTTVVWGSAIGRERLGEAGPSGKVQALLNYVEVNGPLDSGESAQQLDIRDGRVHQLGRHTARRQ